MLQISYWWFSAMALFPVLLFWASFWRRNPLGSAFFTAESKRLRVVKFHLSIKKEASSILHGKNLTLLYVWEKIKYIFPSPLNLFLCNKYLFPTLYCSFRYLLIKHHERIDTQGPRFTCFCSFNVGEFYVFNTQNDLPEKKEKGERRREERNGPKGWT